MSGSINVTGGSYSVQSGQRAFAPFNIVGDVDIGETLVLSLAAGDNIFAVPLGAVGVIIIPPQNEPITNVWLLRTSLNPSDAGLPIVLNHPTTYVFPTPAPTTVILNASVAQAADVDIWFW